jgi:hypothetical protein
MLSVKINNQPGKECEISIATCSPYIFWQFQLNRHDLKVKMLASNIHFAQSLGEQSVEVVLDQTD